MCSYKTYNSFQHINFINFIEFSSSLNSLILMFVSTLLGLLISLIRCLWLNFKHITDVELLSYWNREMICFHIRGMITKPINVDHQNLWIWCHNEDFLWCLFVNASLSIRCRLLLLFIIIKHTIFLNLSWILHLPNLWHASWLILKFRRSYSIISIFHSFNDFLGKYHMSKCVEIIILIFLLICLTFALMNYFDLQMEC